VKGRIAIAAALAALAAVPAAAARPPKHHKPPNTNLVRAQAAYAAMQRDLYVPRYDLYLGHGSQPYSFLWPFSQTLEATLSMSSLPNKVGRGYSRDVANRINNGLGHYWDASKTPPGYDGSVVPPLGDGGTIGYDDNEWIGIALARRYLATKFPPLLQRAGQLFELAVHGWDADPQHACPGGVLFSQDPQNVDRNTITNAPAAELGARLYLITHNRHYLDWARRFYWWVRTCLERTDGLFEDHIDFNGNVDPTIRTYNEGTMVGAGALMYRATRAKTYIRQAVTSARQALRWFNPGRITGDPPYFVAIFFDNLALLDEVTPFPAWRRPAQVYANWAWSTIRDPDNNLFPFDSGSGQVLEQAAMVRIYATLAGAPRL
jgi:Glycosyl hydrolase family 76